MVIEYSVIIVADAQGDDIYACVPDLPGCFATGERLREETLKNITSAIVDYLKLRKRYFPASSISEIISDGEEIVPVSIDLMMVWGEGKHIDVCIPSDIFSKIDDASVDRGISHSEFIAVAAMKEISYSREV